MASPSIWVMQAARFRPWSICPAGGNSPLTRESADAACRSWKGLCPDRAIAATGKHGIIGGMCRGASPAKGDRWQGVTFDCDLLACHGL